MRRARGNRLFSSLPPSDQSTLLHEVWPELFLLQAAYWPVDILTVAKHIHDHGKVSFSFPKYFSSGFLFFFNLFFNEKNSFNFPYHGLAKIY